MFFHQCVLSWLFLTISYDFIHGEEDYNVIHRDGAFEFGYDNPDSFHHSQGNRNNVVRGKFGSRNPKTGAIDTTLYTAGPRGFRPRGKNVVRKYDLNQNGPRATGSRDDPYYDPSEDPSYEFSFNTRTHNRQEAANRAGDVTGKYSYIDDVGERHNVEYIAGKRTGFHVKTPFPDSNPRAYGPLYFRGRGKPIPRGRTSIQRGLDGSYRFISSGPDQRRTETSDATGHVRGSYTYLDDKGVQHSVHYIAGPETGYRVLKNVKGPHLPTVYPFGRPNILPADFYDYLAPDVNDVFDTAASGHSKPSKGGRPSSKDDGFDYDNGSDLSGTTGSGGGSQGSGSGYDDSGSGSRPTGSGSRPGGGGSRPGGSGSRPGGGDSRPGTGGSRPGGGGSRPGGDGSRLGGGGSRPGGSSGSGSGSNRPNSNDDDDYDNFDLFGGDTKPAKPNTGSQSGGGGGGKGNDDDGSYKPTGGDSSYPTTGTGSSGSGSSGSGDDFGLFGGSGSGGSKPSQGGGDDDGGTHIGIRPIDNDDTSGSGYYNQQGTLVTNVGDKLFAVPPGVSVRAHVQAIDLLPLKPRTRSPSEQLRAEVVDQSHAESNNVEKKEIKFDDIFDAPTSTAKPDNKEEEKKEESETL